MVDPETGRVREVQTSDADCVSGTPPPRSSSATRSANTIRSAGGDHLVLRTDEDWLSSARALRHAATALRSTRPCRGRSAMSYGEPIRLWFLLGVRRARRDLRPAATPPAAVRRAVHEHGVARRRRAEAAGLATACGGAGVSRRHRNARHRVRQADARREGSARARHGDRRHRHVVVDGGGRHHADAHRGGEDRPRPRSSTSCPRRSTSGIVSFDGNARLVVAPTTDREQGQARRSATSTCNEGTAIGEAIFTSHRRHQADRHRRRLWPEDPRPHRAHVGRQDHRRPLERRRDEGGREGARSRCRRSRSEPTTARSPCPSRPIRSRCRSTRTRCETIAQQTDGSFFTAASAKELAAGLHGHRLVDRVRPRTARDHDVVRRRRPRRAAGDRGHVPGLVLPSAVIRQHS